MSRKRRGDEGSGRGTKRESGWKVEGTMGGLGKGVEGRKTVWEESVAKNIIWWRFKAIREYDRVGPRKRTWDAIWEYEEKKTKHVKYAE